MNQLVKVFQEIYKPTFDENEDKYIDKSPYKPYERNCIQYECRCKAGAYFKGNTMFKQHIQSKTHKDFIQNYKKYYKEIDEAAETIQKLIADKEIFIRKCNSSQKTNQSLIQKIETLQKLNQNLINTIQEFNEDNEFDDCIS
tara:strand:- start:1172 stop:1597 length:426 start_codon:yes stop_codon:yes gene_type:complete